MTFTDADAAQTACWLTSLTTQSWRLSSHFPQLHKFQLARMRHDVKDIQTPVPRAGSLFAAYYGMTLTFVIFPDFPVPIYQPRKLGSLSPVYLITWRKAIVREVMLKTLVPQMSDTRTSRCSQKL